jgi:methionine synthase I (cobalamin-dependent)
MNRTIAELAAAAPVITDGAWGTELQRRGLAIGECPDAWNLTHPEDVEGVAAAYAEAGSQVVLTTTFRANRIALAGYGLADRVAEINRAGVELSRRGGGSGVMVFASVGPSGKMHMAGEVSDEELHSAFAEQCNALAEAGADALVIETMSEPDEAAIAIGAARATGLPVVGCMVFDSGKNRDRTMMGTTPEQAAARLADAGADVIGANCGCGIEGYVKICVRLRATTGLPVWIKANAGLPEIVDGRITYSMQPEVFAEHATSLASNGAAFIGGCCGTSPAFIRTLRGRLQS